MVACSGSPSSPRSQPLVTLGRHATPTFGAKLFQSVLYPLVPLVNCRNSGTTPPVARGSEKLHASYRLPSPRPEMPHTDASVAADIVSLTGENGVCTS